MSGNCLSSNAGSLRLIPAAVDPTQTIKTKTHGSGYIRSPGLKMRRTAGQPEWGVSPQHPEVCIERIPAAEYRTLPSRISAGRERAHRIKRVRRCRLRFDKNWKLYSARSSVRELESGMRQLAGTRTRYRRAHAAPLAGLISGRAKYKALQMDLERRGLNQFQRRAGYVSARIFPAIASNQGIYIPRSP